MKFPPPYGGWTFGRATPSLRPNPIRQETSQTRQNDTYRTAETVQRNGASSWLLTMEACLASTLQPLLYIRSKNETAIYTNYLPRHV